MVTLIMVTIFIYLLLIAIIDRIIFLSPVLLWIVIGIIMRAGNL